MLWRKNSENPVLLHLASIDPSPKDSPPVRLTSGSRLRIRGRLNRGHRVFFGLTTLHAEGGFAGKYLFAAPIETENDAEAGFEVEVPIEKFKREKEEFPSSPVGLELADFWALTVKENVGLEIIEVELLK